MAILKEQLRDYINDVDQMSQWQMSAIELASMKGKEVDLLSREESVKNWERIIDHRLVQAQQADSVDGYLTTVLMLMYRRLSDVSVELQRVRAALPKAPRRHPLRIPALILAVCFIAMGDMLTVVQASGLADLVRLGAWGAIVVNLALWVGAIALVILTGDRSGER